jgi:hypothetical protein
MIWRDADTAPPPNQQQGFEKFGDHIYRIGNQADTDWLMKKHLL